jgi:hypothetical protein
MGHPLFLAFCLSACVTKALVKIFGFRTERADTVSFVDVVLDRCRTGACRQSRIYSQQVKLRPVPSHHPQVKLGQYRYMTIEFIEGETLDEKYDGRQTSFS